MLGLIDKKVEYSKVIRKILRSLLGRFHPKVTKIKKSKDLDSIKVKELVSFLKTYKAQLPQTIKDMSISLKMVKEN